MVGARHPAHAQVPLASHRAGRPHRHHHGDCGGFDHRRSRHAVGAGGRAIWNESGMGLQAPDGRAAPPDARGAAAQTAQLRGRDGHQGAMPRRRGGVGGPLQRAVRVWLAALHGALQGPRDGGGAVHGCGRQLSGNRQLISRRRPFLHPDGRSASPRCHRDRRQRGGATLSARRSGGQNHRGGWTRLRSHRHSQQVQGIPGRQSRRPRHLYSLLDLTRNSIPRRKIISSAPWRLADRWTRRRTKSEASCAAAVT